jgi:ParB family chromosome partitioning protein
MSRKALKFEINPLLSGPSLDVRTRSGSPYRILPINDIDVDPDQPRRSFDAESIAELASSIEAHGLLCPILVRATEGGTFRLVSGERRLRACRALGLDTIPAILDTQDGEQSDILAKQLVENIQRSDLNPMERALAVGQLKERFNLSVREIGVKLGLSKSSVQRSMDLLNLPDDLQAALISGAPETKVIQLAKVADVSKRRKLLDNLEKLNRDELSYLLESGGDIEELSHRGTVGSKDDISSRIGDSKTQIADQRIEDELRKGLGLKISIKRNPKSPEKGRIVIDFYSKSDLSEIYDRLRP